MPQDIKYEIKEFAWREENGQLVLRQVIESEKAYTLGEAEQLRQEWEAQAQQNRARNTEEQIQAAQRASEELDEKTAELSKLLQPLRQQAVVQAQLAQKKASRGKKR